MAEENTETLKDTAEDYRSAGINAVMEVSSTSVDQVEDQPITPSPDAEKTDGAEKADVKDDAKPDDEGKEKEEKEDKGPVPYTRFSEVIKEKNTEREARLVAEAEARTLREEREKRAEIQAEKAKPAEELPYRDTSKMTKDELIEWKTDFPDEYEQNLVAKTIWETKQEVFKELDKRASQADYNTQIETISKALNEYKKVHPDFEEMWNKGDIKKFMDANPLYGTAVAAYEQMTLDKRISVATEKAAKEAADKTRKEFEAKGHAKVETGGGSGTVIRGSGDDSLKTARGRAAEDMVYKRHLERMADAGH
jgi:hypothetical protein